jgi:hypothetical protein
MGGRRVRLLLGRRVPTSLQDQAAAGFLDLDKRAVLRLVGKIALQHALACLLLQDQARQRRSDYKQALHRHAVGPLSSKAKLASDGRRLSCQREAPRAWQRRLSSREDQKQPIALAPSTLDDGVPGYTGLVRRWSRKDGLFRAILAVNRRRSP